jgi:hypothetical protein
MPGAATPGRWDCLFLGLGAKNMKTYENTYTKSEDHTLWELHEIRHRLHKKRKGHTVEEINKAALKRYSDWQAERKGRNPAEKGIKHMR